MALGKLSKPAKKLQNLERFQKNCSIGVWLHLMKNLIRYELTQLRIEQSNWLCYRDLLVLKAYFIVRLTLKFYRFCSVLLATSLFTRSIVALFWIHGWFMASRADIRSSGLYLRSWTTRSLASALTSSHSGSSSVYCPDSTALII